MKNIPILAFIILMITIGCYHHPDKSTILTDQLKSLLKSNYDPNTDYLIINQKGCMGCVAHNIAYLSENPKKLSQFKFIIITKSIDDQFAQIRNLKTKLIIDSLNMLDQLNSGISGLSVVKIRNNQVLNIKNSDVRISSSKDSLNAFYYSKNSLKNENIFFKELFREDFEKQFPDKLLGIIHSKKTTVLFFTSDYCTPCKVMHPMIDSLSLIYYESVEFYYIKGNKKDNMKVFYDYKVQATPTLMVFKNGKRIVCNTGIMDRTNFLKLIL